MTPGCQYFAAISRHIHARESALLPRRFRASFDDAARLTQPLWVQSAHRGDTAAMTPSTVRHDTESTYFITRGRFPGAPARRPSPQTTSSTRAGSSRRRLRAQKAKDRFRHARRRHQRFSIAATSYQRSRVKSAFPRHSKGHYHMSLLRAHRRGHDGEELDIF